MAKLACVGTEGPAFIKAGRIPLYDPVDLDSWAERRISRKYYSTAEYAAEVPLFSNNSNS